MAHFAEGTIRTTKNLFFFLALYKTRMDQLLVSLFEPEEKKGNFWYPIQNILHHCSLERTMNRRGAEEGKNGVIIIIPSHLLKLFSWTKKKNSKASSSPTDPPTKKSNRSFLSFPLELCPWITGKVESYQIHILNLYHYYVEYNEDS